MRESLFEYDNEADEAADEADEAFEATDEAADEADEAFEATDEADEADEAFEATDEAADEADEAFEATDEAADEAADEGVSVGVNASLSARLAVERDRERRRKLAQQLANDRRNEARAASAVQQSLTSSLRKIRGSGPTPTRTVGSLNGVPTMTLILANGRRAPVRVVPRLASASEVNRLRNAFNVNEQRRAASDAANSRAIRRLADAQAKFIARQTAQQVASDQKLAKRIEEVSARLDKRITTEVATQKANLEKNNKRMVRRMKKLRRQSLMNDVLLATATTFFVAYAKRNPFAPRNLAMTGILTGWLVSDELIGMATGSSKSSKAWSRVSSALSVAAPIGNGLTNYLLFGKEPSDRFVSGVTTIKSGKTQSDLVRIAKEESAFAKVTDPKVVTVTSVLTAAEVAKSVKAEVHKGQLMLTLSGQAGTDTDIAWVVDLDSESTAISAS